MNYYKNIVSQILKMTSDGFIITDTEGNVREINKQYAEDVYKRQVLFLALVVHSVCQDWWARVLPKS